MFLFNKGGDKETEKKGSEPGQNWTEWKDQPVKILCVNTTNGTRMRFLLFSMLGILLVDLGESQIINNWTGSLGPSAVGAVNQVDNVFNILTKMFFFLVSGVTARISYYMGKGQYANMGVLIQLSFIVSYVAGALIGGVMFGLKPQIFTWLAIDPVATPYYYASAWGLPFSIMSQSVGGIFFGTWDLFFMLGFTIVESGVNILLTFLFIMVAHMGVEGVQLANNFSAILGQIIVIGYLMRKENREKYKLGCRRPGKGLLASFSHDNSILLLRDTLTSVTPFITTVLISYLPAYSPTVTPNDVSGALGDVDSFIREFALQLGTGANMLCGFFLGRKLFAMYAKMLFRCATIVGPLAVGLVVAGFVDQRWLLALLVNHTTADQINPFIMPPLWIIVMVMQLVNGAVGIYEGMAFASQLFTTITMFTIAGVLIVWLPLTVFGWTSQSLLLLTLSGAGLTLFILLGHIYVVHYLVLKKHVVGSSPSGDEKRSSLNDDAEAAKQEAAGRVEDEDNYDDNDTKNADGEARRPLISRMISPVAPGNDVARSPEPQSGLGPGKANSQPQLRPGESPVRFNANLATL